VDLVLSVRAWAGNPCDALEYVSCDNRNMGETRTPPLCVCDGERWRSQDEDEHCFPVNCRDCNTCDSTGCTLVNCPVVCDEFCVRGELRRAEHPVDVNSDSEQAVPFASERRLDP